MSVTNIANNGLRSSFVVGAFLLVSVSANLLYPGEVFFQSKYLLIIGSLFSCLIATVIRCRKTAVRDVLRCWIVVFLPLVILAISSVNSINRYRTEEVLWLFLSYTCMSLAFRLVNVNYALLISVPLCICVATLGVNCLSLHQYFIGFGELQQTVANSSVLEESFRSSLLGRIGTRRVFANFALPNSLAGLQAIVLPLYVLLFHEAKRARNGELEFPSKWMERLLAHRVTPYAIAVQCVFSLAVLAMTKSFGGWVGMCISVGFFGFYLLSNRNVPWRKAVGMLLGVFVVGGTWIAWLTYSRGFGLWNFGVAENPIALRWVNFKTALAIFCDFPWTGVGLGNYGSINPLYQSSRAAVTQYAHNTVLQLLSECGVLWVLLACVGFYLAVQEWQSWRIRSLNGKAHREFALMCLWISLAVWLVHNLLDINLYFPSLGGMGVILWATLSGYRITTLNLSDSPEPASITPGGRRPLRLFLGLIVVLFGIAVSQAIRNYLAEAYLFTAVDAVELRDFAGAEKLAYRSIALRNGNPGALILHAKLSALNLSRRAKLGPEALLRLRSAYESATRIDPFNANYHYELSRLLMALGEKEKADQEQRQASKLFPAESKFKELPAPSAFPNQKSVKPY